MNFPTTLALGVTVFVTSNIDDLFVLLGFFSDPKFRARNIIIGQCVGMAVLVLVSICAALIALAILPSYIGLLGLAPIAIGMKRLVDLARGREAGDENLLRQPEGGTRGQSLAVAVVTVANGGDNVAIYTPIFAVHRGVETAAIVAVFALMTAMWCSFSHWLVHHRTIGVLLRRYGHRVLPVVLIGLGGLVMLKAGAFELLSKMLGIAAAGSLASPSQ
jgi:cadmium resistance protein CadD (predicted permease)